MSGRRFAPRWTTVQAYRDLRQRCKKHRDWLDIDQYAGVHAHREIVGLLDALQRRIDGWAADAASAGEDPAPYRDFADHVRDLLTEVGAVDRETL